jgi:hypothetical protein
MKLYLAYGSNLNITQMKKRCPNAEVIGASKLLDHRLAFRGNSRSGVLNIEPLPGGSVPVVVWKISDWDEGALDWYEGYPCLYTKQRFTVALDGHNLHTMAYIMTPGHRYAPPCDSYLRICADGYDYFGFDTNILYDAVAVAKKLSPV